MSKYIKIGVGLVLAIILFYSLKGSNQFNLNQYVAEVDEHRQQKDRFMKFNAESPLPENLREPFSNLMYYPVDTSYRKIATLEPIENSRIITLDMTGGQPEKYREYGYARFSHQGNMVNLLVLRSLESGDLFLPFLDQSNGKGTYGGGRYLDPKEISSNRILIDFNFAYNPFCVFSETYNCPVPPLQNKVPFAVEAGEKMWEM